MNVPETQPIKRSEILKNSHPTVNTLSPTQKCVIGIRESHLEADYPVDVWFDSLKSAANILSVENRQLMEIIRSRKPKTVTELAGLTDRAVSNVSRTLKTLREHNLISMGASSADAIATAEYNDFVVLMGENFKHRNQLDEASELLDSIAQLHTPSGTERRAVIDQWLHSVATGGGFFCNADVCNAEQLKSTVIEILTKNCIFINQTQFFELVFGKLNLKPVGKPDFRFIDLFAGIGGMRLGLQSAGGACVFSSEYDKSAQKTYKINHGELPFGDITMIDADSIPDHDILLAGFPCQPFSHAGVSARNAVGKEHGFSCNTQGTLFFDILRVVDSKRPSILFLENVRNLVRHDSGNTFKTVKDSIEERGYHFSYKIISSSTVVPQRRVRCYMVCVRKDIGGNFSFPDFSGDDLPLSSILQKEVDDRYTISDRLWEGHIARSKRNVERGTGFTAYTADLSKPSNTIVARYGKDGKECLVPQDGKNPRLLTQRECARLLGFPEEFKYPEARTPAYKQFGNSVVVPIVSVIAKKIKEDLL